PHPALARCFRHNLRSRQLDCYDYAATANPPILHRKETFLCPEHPLYNKFARLTRQEEKHGLLADTARIGTRTGWEIRLTEAGVVGGGGGRGVGGGRGEGGGGGEKRRARSKEQGVESAERGAGRKEREA